jgi:hypothetical protein
VDAKNFGAALTLLTKAAALAGHGEVFDRRAQQELQAFVHDSFAYFYYRRGKHEAALHYAQKAMQVGRRSKRSPQPARAPARHHPCRTRRGPVPCARTHNASAPFN